MKRRDPGMAQIGTGYRTSYDGKRTGLWHADGSLVLGTNIGEPFDANLDAPGTTYLVFVARDRTVNGEAMGKGDFRLGDSTAGKANMVWDASAGTLLFRTGPTTTASFGTDGGLTLQATASEADAGYLRWYEGTTPRIKVIGLVNTSIVQLYTEIDTASASEDARFGWMAQRDTSNYTRMDLLNNEIGTDLHQWSLTFVDGGSGATALTAFRVYGGDFILTGASYYRPGNGAVAQSTNYIAGTTTGIGINDTTPSHLLDVNGTFRAVGVATFDANPAGTITSGVYTPTLTSVANVDSSTAYECTYKRVGSTVTVAGVLDADPTTTATLTRIGISLPVASNIGGAGDVGGTAFCNSIAGEGAAILEDSANDRAEMRWICSGTASRSMYFQFQYQVI